MMAHVNTEQRTISAIDKITRSRHTPDVLEKHHKLTDDLGGDSLTAIFIVMALEEEFDIHIHDDTELDTFQTVGDVINFMESLNQ